MGFKGVKGICVGCSKEEGYVNVEVLKDWLSRDDKEKDWFGVCICRGCLEKVEEMNEMYRDEK